MNTLPQIAPKPSIALQPPSASAEDSSSGIAQLPRATEPQQAPSDSPQSRPGYISIRKYDFFYGSNQVLFGINMEIPRRQVTALIGPSGCGKSTLLRNINRMNDLVDGVHHRGDIVIDGSTIYNPHLEVTSLRKRIGMVFQKSNPFPKSIYENVVYGLRVAGGYSKQDLDKACEEALKSSALWDEVKDRLNASAMGLSGGPEVLLMDEPCSALDPIATAKIEELIMQLKAEFTLVLVTHNMQQAARSSDNTAFFYLGKLIEYDKTNRIFTNPGQKQTEDYITGRFG